MTFLSKVRILPIKEMGVAKKGRGNNFQNCSTSSKVFYGCQLVISGEKSFLARSATICKINTVWLPTITGYIRHSLAQLNDQKLCLAKLIWGLYHRFSLANRKSNQIWYDFFK